tara:strand:- start:316 stop:537 length:222 start_codon:yes stop_codon:yes gene_type:complete
MSKLFIWFILFYQKVISPLVGPCCRFHPTCSNFAKEAIEAHGLLRGTWLALKRISRCHPLGSSGFDPVPSRKK